VNEEQARAWLRGRFGHNAFTLLERYVAALLEANSVQNMISRASEQSVWTRHIADSAQLAEHAPVADTWLDIGSGPGLPGVVLAIVTEKPVLLVEPRRKRVQFLEEVIGLLALSNATVKQSTVERVGSQKFGAITARAYAPLPDIFSSTVRLTNPSTIWVLPKGKSAPQELDEARQAWQGVFHVKQSLTDEQARIIVATSVRPR
jgi:16S rRNA (guanine527-N7)-methyltransferase